MSMPDQPVVTQTRQNIKMAKLFHPGLLWIEWRQHRYLFVLLCLNIMLQPALLPLFIQAFIQVLVLRPGLTVVSDSNPWVSMVNGIIQSGGSIMEVTTIIAVLLLAAIMVGHERGNSLNYLASTPVARRQILAAKWMTGSLAILTSMVLLSAYMFGVARLNPGSINPVLLYAWAGSTTAALLCLFSLALLSASICSSILYSAVFTGFFLMLPMMLSFLIINTLSKYAVLSADQATSATQWLNHLNIIDYYIMQEGGNGWSNSAASFAGIPLLLLAGVIFLILAMRAFERNPLERTGEFLLSGNSKETGRLMVACLFAPLYATELAGSPGLFLIYLPLIAFGIYLGIGILWRTMAVLGLSKRST
ncbi:MAG: ABC transporter permease subunit [Syntrophomonadaceae bacterium]